MVARFRDSREPGAFARRAARVGSSRWATQSGVRQLRSSAPRKKRSFAVGVANGPKRSEAAPCSKSRDRRDTPGGRFVDAAWPRDCPLGALLHLPFNRPLPGARALERPRLPLARQRRPAAGRQDVIEPSRAPMRSRRYRHRRSAATRTTIASGPVSSSSSTSRPRALPCSRNQVTCSISKSPHCSTRWSSASLRSPRPAAGPRATPVRCRRLKEPSD